MLPSKLKSKSIRPEEVTVAIFNALVKESVAVALSFNEEIQCFMNTTKICI